MINTDLPEGYQADAALEALLYVAEQSPETDYLDLFRIVFLADVTHLRQFGTQMHREQYIAFQGDPVASGLLSLVTEAGLGSGETDAFRVTARNIIEPRRRFDPRKLDEAARECLDFALQAEIEDRVNEVLEANPATGIAECDLVSMEAILESVSNRDQIEQFMEDSLAVV